MSSAPVSYTHLTAAGIADGKGARLTGTPKKLCLAGKRQNPRGAVLFRPRRGDFLFDAPRGGASEDVYKRQVQQEGAEWLLPEHSRLIIRLCQLRDTK